MVWPGDVMIGMDRCCMVMNGKVRFLYSAGYKYTRQGQVRNCGDLYGPAWRGKEMKGKVL